MALTNYERVKRWREKNRALYNLQRRNRRKTKTAVPVLAESDAPKPSPSVLGKTEDEARESTLNQPEVNNRPSDSCGGSQSFTTKKVGEFRMIVMNDSKPIEETPVKPRIFTDDFGRVITERAWNILQERKRRAKEGGYSVDDYSQG